MGKVIAFLGIILVAGAVMVWKYNGDDATVTKTGSDDKGKNGTDMKVTEKKLTTKTSYQNPAGADEVGFNVTVNAEGVVTDATVDILAEHAVSKTRQLAFSDGFAAALKGKKLSELTAIDKVGGSSLTTGAFNAALPQLQTQL